MNIFWSLKALLPSWIARDCKGEFELFSSSESLLNPRKGMRSTFVFPQTFPWPIKCNSGNSSYWSRESNWWLLMNALTTGELNSRLHGQLYDRLKIYSELRSLAAVSFQLFLLHLQTEQSVVVDCRILIVINVIIFVAFTTPSWLF